MVRQYVHVPEWLQACADEIAATEEASSVILFGSRVHSYATRASDWDVAVLHHAVNSSWLCPYEARCAEKRIQLAGMRVDDYNDGRNKIGSLAYELSHDGLLLAGKVPAKPRSREFDEVDTEALEWLLTSTFRKLSNAVIELKRECESATDRATDLSMYSSPASGDCAEYMAKALSICCGRVYPLSHHLPVIAQNLPAEWRAQIESLNGDNKNQHLVHYSPLSKDRKSISAVANRVEQLFELLDNSFSLLTSELPRESRTRL